MSDFLSIEDAPHTSKRRTLSRGALVLLFLFTLSMLLMGCTTTAFDSLYEKRSAGIFGNLDIPDGELPPQGSCRIWHPGDPPEQQPPAGDCARLAGQAPPGAWLLERPEKERVHVHVFDESRRGQVTSVRIFDASSGTFLRERPPR